MAVPTRSIAAGLLAAAILTGLALYGTGSDFAKLGPSQPCTASRVTAERVAPLARGEVAALDVSEAPRPAPPLRFTGPDGAERDLTSFEGKSLLVNFWATWCGPCKAEMPALDRLQAEFGGKDFEVVAINVETRNLDRIPTWLSENWIDHLRAYVDPAGRVLPLVQQRIGTIGLPTTMLIDRAGCDVGVMKAGAQWDSDDGKRVIRALIGSGT